MQNQEALRKHLLELEERLLDSETRSTPEGLNQLLAEAFFEFGSSGKVFHKRDFMQEEGIAIYKMKASDFAIQELAADVVLATYKIIDETRNRRTLRSSLWKGVEGTWQMVFHQGTIIPNE
ncbi:hypothetical protein GCM10011391_15970 [Pullulanibacillus camelliae]|uniref:DUF4440 domain-containing protein n=1 Tax=Pullulanibacillus camelliae TaxID=1707096 RepID=A0A8J2VRN3_9BACL|nr:DUF4440 domain-containing protein [Pullulanibacillus camelliae]GGE37981.1 hypothetical protein GCM10011391_15970 [Pullulanibacillus camelliae]